MHWTRFT